MSTKKQIINRLRLMLTIEADEFSTVQELVEKRKISPDFTTDTGILIYDPDDAQDWDDDEWDQLRTWQDSADDWNCLTAPIWEARDKPALFALLRPLTQPDVFLTKLLIPVCFDNEVQFRSELAFLAGQYGLPLVRRFADEYLADNNLLHHALEDDDGNRHAFTAEVVDKYRQIANQMG